MTIEQRQLTARAFVSDSILDRENSANEYDTTLSCACVNQYSLIYAFSHIQLPYSIDYLKLLHFVLYGIYFSIKKYIYSTIKGKRYTAMISTL
jgi:hypothetical protein